MKIEKGFPPNIAEIAKRFRITPETVFAYGDTLYSPLGLGIPPDLMVHEEVHERQQSEAGVEQWWAMYLENESFRLSQEVEAYRAQWKYLQGVLNRKGRLAALNRLAENLASPMYGSIINKKLAKELIDNE
jgi:hypothetical protein